MLKIRAAQIEVLGRENEAGMEGRALRHLQNCLPDVCATLGEAELRRIIQFGRGRAKSHDIRHELDFFRYLNLMFMFGLEFDTDPRYPWAARTLQTDKQSRVKMDLLMDHALLFCSQNASEQAAE